MGKYRFGVISAAETLAAAAVRVIQLKGLAPISEMLITVRATNSNGTPVAHHAKIVKGVQIVDGSNVLVNLNGQELMALEYYHYKKVGVHVLSYINGNISTLFLRIPFGRWLWDSEYALDPARFSNLQLILDVDEALGGSTPTASSIQVSANMFDEKKIQPKGFISSKRHFTYTMVASSVVPVDLPTDMPIKMIMPLSRAAAKAFNTQFSRFKLTEDFDAHVNFDETATNLVKAAQNDIPPYIEKVLFPQTAASVVFFVTPAYEEHVAIGNILDIDTYSNAVPNYGGSVSIGGAAATDLAGIVQGYCPHGSIAFEMGDPWDPEDWFVPRKGGSLQLIITGGASLLASSTCQVILQQLQRYQ